ncbi:succinyl-diaminopimelate desuccinylase [Rarobacter incanus]|nr:succinyl-diaminopimelate desuccinylase [Rarobacter incanus]
MPSLDLTRGSSGLTALVRALCDTRSVSGDERELADAVEDALRALPADRVVVTRLGNNIIARTNGAGARRVILAGHLDTVPVADNLPTREIEEGGETMIWGRGTVDMKAGLAVMMQVFADIVSASERPLHELTLVAYDNEEVASELNGLGHLVAEYPELLAGDFAVLGEPSAGGIEGGCNGTVRVHVMVPGVAAHSARAWMGVNAIHGAAEVLNRLRDYKPATICVDGLDYRESLNAVKIVGGIAGNVIPDACTVTVNYRFAPSMPAAQAIAFLRDFFSPYEVQVDDEADGARPGLDAPIAREFVDAVGAATGKGAVAKVGWTDVARFSVLGVPAVNFGPGDPTLAHHDQERVSVRQVIDCYAALHSWLTNAADFTR